MAHQIVLVRLEPEWSATHTYAHAPTAAQRLKTRPFLALCLHTTHHSPSVTNPRYDIYPISTVPFQGPGPAAIRCFSLLPAHPKGSNGDMANIPSLTIVPPLPEPICRQLRSQGKNLYLHSTPELHVRQFTHNGEPDSDSEEDADDPCELSGLGVTPYRLADSSFQRFLEAVRDRTPWLDAKHDEAVAATRTSLDPDVVFASSGQWEYFGIPPWPEEVTPVMNRAFFVFDLLDVLSDDPLVQAQNESVESDISLYQQVLDDYSDDSVIPTLTWINEMRHHEVNEVLYPPPNGDINLPALSPELLCALRAVQGMLLPHDSDDPGNGYASVHGKPHDHFPALPWEYKHVPFQPDEVKIVLFDVFGTILDRQSALSRYLSPLGPLSPHLYTSEALGIRYETLEALTARAWSSDNGALSLRALVQSALSRFLEVYAISLPNPEQFSLLNQDMISDLGGPFADVVPSLTALHRQANLHLACMHPDDPDIRAAIHRAVPDGLLSSFSDGYELQGIHLQRPALYSDKLLAHFATRVPGLTSKHVLIVTTGGARQVEVASEHGFQTVLLKRPGNLEAEVNLSIIARMSGPQASLEVESLRDLCVHLGIADVPIQ